MKRSSYPLKSSFGVNISLEQPSSNGSSSSELSKQKTDQLKVCLYKLLGSLFLSFIRISYVLFHQLVGFKLGLKLVTDVMMR